MRSTIVCRAGSRWIEEPPVSGRTMVDWQERRATALTERATVATSNPDDFSRFEGYGLTLA